MTSITSLLNTIDGTGYRMLLWLLSLLWQSSVVLAAVLGMQAILRSGSASWRHRILLASLLMIPAIPLLCLLTGAVENSRFALPVFPESLAWQTAATEGSAVFVPAALEISGIRLLPLQDSIGDLSRLSPWAIIMVLCLTGMFVMSVKVIGGLLKVRSWIRNSRPVTDGEILAVFEKARTCLGVKRSFRVAESDQVAVPVTAGTFRPVVLLPVRFIERIQPAGLEGIALHEMAHIRRNDSLFFTLVSILRAILFFHPLIWLAARRLAALAESACDDAVLAVTRCPQTYALLLTAVAENLPGRYLPPEPATGFLLRGMSLQQRVTAILSKRRGQMRMRSKLGLAAALAGVVLSYITAVAVPLVHKNSEPQPADSQTVQVKTQPATVIREAMAQSVSVSVQDTIRHRIASTVRTVVYSETDSVHKIEVYMPGRVEAGTEVSIETPVAIDVDVNGPYAAITLSDPDPILDVPPEPSAPPEIDTPPLEETDLPEEIELPEADSLMPAPPEEPALPAPEPAPLGLTINGESLQIDLDDLKIKPAPGETVEIEVVVDYAIDENGKVAGLRIISEKPEGSGAAEAVIEAFQRATFRPADSPAAAEVRIRQTFDFVVGDQSIYVPTDESRPD